MTYFELFQQGPAVYIPVLLIMLGITLLAYGAFPIIFAKTRKKTITKKKYNLLCYGINFFVMFLFIAFNGGSSGGPYILWTGIFSSIGFNTLKKRGVLDGFQPIKAEKIFQDQKSFSNAEKQCPNETEEIRFCRKCGNKLLDGAKFCNKCGTAAIKED